MSKPSEGFGMMTMHEVTERLQLSVRASTLHRGETPPNTAHPYVHQAECKASIWHLRLPTISFKNTLGYNVHENNHIIRAKGYPGTKRDLGRNSY